MNLWKKSIDHCAGLQAKRRIHIRNHHTKKQAEDPGDDERGEYPQHWILPMPFRAMGDVVSVDGGDDFPELGGDV